MLSQKAVYFFIFKLFLKLSEIVNISDQQLDILLDEGPVKVFKKKKQTSFEEWGVGRMSKVKN